MGDVIELELPASLEALAEQAARMFAEIDAQKARLFVEQAANGHSDDDLCTVVIDGVRLSYRERREGLELSEQRLRGALPPSVLTALASSTLAALSD